MALTQTQFDSMLCNAKNCYSLLAYNAVKNRTFGEEEEYCEKVPQMKKLYSLIYVMESEYNARFADCEPCSCNSQPYSGDPDTLSCPETCLDDDGICALNEKVKILCDAVKGNCN